MQGIKDKIRIRWYLRWVLLLTNWAMQGIPRADTTEKIYKIFFSIFSSLFFFILFNVISSISFGNSILFSLFLGHTTNWIINGSISAIFSHRLYIGNLQKKKAFNYIYDLKKRLIGNKYISSCAVFGSISRGELKGSSDIDICFIRNSGLKNACLAILFMVREKIKTNLGRIPIEPYLADSVDYMKKRYRSDEPPVIILDRNGIIRDNYKRVLSISNAAEINDVIRNK
jgi:predicted nucleotidyltransferase